MTTVKNYLMLAICCLMLVGTSRAQERQGGKKTTKKLIEQIVGVWQLEGSVDKAKKQAVQRKDTIGMEWTEFRPDGRYKSGSNGQAGAMQPVDSGSYRLNETQNLLYLQSDLDKKEVSHAPSEWALSLKGETMTLVGQGNTHAKRYQFVYRKVKDGLSTNQ
jgi:hypothetical protein